MPQPSPRVKSTNVRFPLRILLRLSSLSPTLGARLLERIFLTPRRHPMPDRERNWLDSAEERIFESRGRRLRAWRWGPPGPTVLLVHGWEGRGAQLGAYVAPLLSKGFRVVTFDGPGHGASDGNRSSLVEMASSVLDAAREFGPFHGAIAHSAGAAATTLALRDGASIGRLVYVAPPADLGEFLSRLSTALALPAETLEMARRRIEDRFHFRWATIAHDHLARSMRTPLLVIHDSGDREIELENGVRLTARWSGSRLEVTSGLGHRRILRDSEVVSRAVSFLHSQAETVGTASAPSDASSIEASTTRSFPSVFAR